MSDLFQPDVPFDFTGKVFDIMEQASWHTFQVLTKRPALMRRFVKARYERVGCPAHIWLGVSVEDQRRTARVRILQGTPAKVRFLSVEPLLGPLHSLGLDGIHWVIVGGESGPALGPCYRSGCAA